MFNTACKKCDAAVTFDNKACPSCGTKNPGVRWYHMLAGGIGLVVLIPFGILLLTLVYLMIRAAV